MVIYIAREMAFGFLCKLIGKNRQKVLNLYVKYIIIILGGRYEKRVSSVSNIEKRVVETNR